MSSIWEPIPPGGTGLNTSYGPTSARPTTVNYLYFEYFDTTIGYPIYATQLTGTPIIWVNSSGVAV